ncbi:hypothetical protein RM543_10305 [Roseicyclus sp. F158]|uniref:Uncharacterized protein n=1 Tax=Tropicimonas omnivorans TaxID=3075590 RepID=A0ABU3DH81_9RHOB|nr:hypothetical protein [Roseicyclus sp. F158]MDT0683078.1 hypothetical protein [Roseicyclus sp. F158]
MSPDIPFQDTLWRRTARGGFDRADAVPERAEVAVIGGGSDRADALHLARAGREVAVLEAGPLGGLPLRAKRLT